jgi:uncharacterized protein YggE
MTLGPVLTAIAMAGALTAAAAVHAEDDGAAVFHATTLNVAAVGEVKAAPDQATLTLGVRASGKTAAQAMAANRERMNGTIAALTAQGIQKKDIQTSNLSLDAQYAYEPNQSPRLTGYDADNDVSVVIHDVNRVGAAVDAVTAGGANQVNGIAFGLADPAPTMDEARRAAVKTLRTRADLYAQALGLRVIRLVNLSEGAPEQPIGPRPLPMMAMAKVAAPTPVEPGQLTIDVQLTAVYELGQ